MQTVNIHAAKTHLSRLVEQAAAGEEIIIAKAGKPIARLMPLAAPKKEPRKLGLLQGRLPEGADRSALMQPTFTEEELDEIYNEPLFPPPERLSEAMRQRLAEQGEAEDQPPAKGER